MLISGVLQTKRWHSAAGVFQQINSDSWVTMTPPPHHVTMLSPVQMRVGEMPEFTGKVELAIYGGKRSERAVVLHDYTLLGEPYLIERAGPLHVLCRPSTSSAHTPDRHIKSAKDTKTCRGVWVWEWGKGRRVGGGGAREG